MEGWGKVVVSRVTSIWFFGGVVLMKLVRNLPNLKTSFKFHIIKMYHFLYFADEVLFEDRIDGKNQTPEWIILQYCLHE